MVADRGTCEFPSVEFHQELGALLRIRIVVVSAFDDRARRVDTQQGNAVTLQGSDDRVALVGRAGNGEK